MTQARDTSWVSAPLGDRLKRSCMKTLLVQAIFVFNALAMLPMARARGGWGSVGVGGWLSQVAKPLPTLRQRGFQFQLPATEERGRHSRLSAAFSSDASDSSSSASAAPASASPDSLVSVLDNALEKEATKRASLER